jgi:hypothetical protein
VSHFVILLFVYLTTLSLTKPLKYGVSFSCSAGSVTNGLCHRLNGTHGKILEWKVISVADQIMLRVRKRAPRTATPGVPALEWLLSNHVETEMRKGLAQAGAEESTGIRSRAANGATK